MGITLLGELFRSETGPLFEVRDLPAGLEGENRLDSLIMPTTSDPEVYPEPK